MKLVIEVDDQDFQRMLESIIPIPTARPQLSVVVKEAAIELYLGGEEEFSAADIFRQATLLYGGALNRQSLTLRVVGCTPNHSSFKHAVTKRDYLKHLDWGTYTLSDTLLNEIKERIECSTTE